MIAWLESRWGTMISQNDATRLKSQSVTRGSNWGQFQKISKHLIDKPNLFAHKEMSFYASLMISMLVLIFSFDCTSKWCYDTF